MYRMGFTAGKNLKLKSETGSPFVGASVDYCSCRESIYASRERDRRTTKGCQVITLFRRFLLSVPEQREFLWPVPTCSGYLCTFAAVPLLDTRQCRVLGPCLWAAGGCVVRCAACKCVTDEPQSEDGDCLAWTEHFRPNKGGIIIKGGCTRQIPINSIKINETSTPEQRTNSRRRRGTNINTNPIQLARLRLFLARSTSRGGKSIRVCIGRDLEAQSYYVTCASQSMRTRDGGASLGWP